LLRAPYVVVLRVLSAITVSILFFVSSYLLGAALHMASIGWFPADIGNPSTDPHGRGIEDSADLFGVGPLIIVLFSAIAGWLTWLTTFRANRTMEFWICSTVFSVFSVITIANYIRMDTIFTRDAQAVLNLFLVASTASLLAISEPYISRIGSVFFSVLARFLQALAMYTFLAAPIWYTISFLSWKIGAGELKSLDEAAKAVAGAASLMGTAGLTWKNGGFSRPRQAKSSQPPTRS